MRCCLRPHFIHLFSHLGSHLTLTDFLAYFPSSSPFVCSTKRISNEPTIQSSQLKNWLNKSMDPTVERWKLQSLYKLDFWFHDMGLVPSLCFSCFSRSNYERKKAGHVRPNWLWRSKQEITRISTWRFTWTGSWMIIWSFVLWASLMCLLVYIMWSYELLRKDINIKYTYIYVQICTYTCIDTYILGWIDNLIAEVST